MTTEERQQKCTNVCGAAIATLGWIDLMQNPEPDQKIDRDECLSKAHAQAERALKLAQELLTDAWGKS
jgi:hypothetical protein